LALRLVPKRTLSLITAEHLFRRGAAPLIAATNEKDVHWQQILFDAPSVVDGLRVDTQSPVAARVTFSERRYSIFQFFRHENVKARCEHHGISCAAFGQAPVPATGCFHRLSLRLIGFSSRDNTEQTAKFYSISLWRATAINNLSFTDICCVTLQDEKYLP
jgi:hypothetical protein